MVTLPLDRIDCLSKLRINLSKVCGCACALLVWLCLLNPPAQMLSSPKSAAHRSLHLNSAGSQVAG